MKNKNRRINYKNIGLFIVLLIALGILVHDIIIVASTIAQFSVFGLITFIGSMTIVAAICDYFDEYLEKKAFVTANNKCKK